MAYRYTAEVFVLDNFNNTRVYWLDRENESSHVRMSKQNPIFTKQCVHALFSIRNNYSSLNALVWGDMYLQDNDNYARCWWFQYLKPLVVPRFRESAGTLNLIRLSVRPSVPSVCLSQKNFNLGHNFCIITGRALILGMCVLCDKTFPMVPCCDLDRDLWPTSRSNLLPSG